MKANVTVVSVVSLLCAGVLGCDGGKKNHPNVGQDEREIFRDESREFAIALDAVVKENANVLWSSEIQIKYRNGEAVVALNQERVSLAKITEEASKLKVHLGDAIDVKLTAERVTPEKADVLATNIEAMAFRTETTRTLWNSQCKDFGNSSIQIDLDSLQSGKFKLGGDGKSLQITIRVCDFENLLVAPVLAIEPQSAIQLHNVVFRCEGVNGSSYLVDVSKPTCRYGYRPEANGKSAENVVPAGTDVKKEFKPEISVDFSNTHGRQQYNLYTYFTDLSQLPAFATKANACDRMDVVMYELDSPEKEYRLHFRNGGNGWVALDDLGTRPKLSNPSSLEFFLHCHWRGEVRPGNTISIPYVR